jgi:TrmH family RNA methyltransferase
MPFRSLEDIVVRRNSIVVVIDGLEIPGNVGAIIRTADGAGGSGVIVCSRRARLTHPKVIRASHGTCFRVPVVECTVKEAFGWLEANHFDVFLVDANQGIPYYTACYETQTAFVLGNEKYGISPEWYRLTESRISVPMNGSADSLNVAVAGAIVIYDAWVKTQNNMADIRHTIK